MVRAPIFTGTPDASTNDGTLMNDTRDTRVTPSTVVISARARICPAGASSTSAGPPPAGEISPRSNAIVITAMMPWPHIVLNPSLCMNRTPACESGRSGSVRSAPYMSECPRGSNMSARRRWSWCCFAQARFSRMVVPFGAGHPSMMSLSGSPAVCASIVRNVEYRALASTVR